MPLIYTYDLPIGLPHTNYNQLAEYLMLMQVGHFQWQSIARTIQTPLSELRTKDGGEVYATFYYIEEQIPEGTTLPHFQLDDTVRFLIHLRGFKNIAVDGRIIFHHKHIIEQAAIQSDDEFIKAYSTGLYPSIRLSNVFVTPLSSNETLKLASPVNASFDHFQPLANQENAYNITRMAGAKGTFGLFDSDDWVGTNPSTPFSIVYDINPDRDSNGAGLVYFANYIAFFDWAERKSLSDYEVDLPVERLHMRTLRSRQLAYYGNVNLEDSIRITILRFQNKRDNKLIGFRYRITRVQDEKLICLSEAIKSIPLSD
jgi:probable biosynthetic protein (TIGR04098 family)